MAKVLFVKVTDRPIEGHHMYREQSAEIIATGLENGIKAASKF